MNSLKMDILGVMCIILVFSVGINILTIQSISKKKLLIAERERIILEQQATIDKQQQNFALSQQASEEINAQRQKNLDYMRGYYEAVSKINNNILEIDLPDSLVSLLP